MTTQWQNQFKNPIDFLLLEDGVSFLLQEDGVSLLILEQTGSGTNLWTNQAKN